MNDQSPGFRGRLVIFGSSSVQGRGDPANGGFVGRLRQWHESQNESNVVFNLGISGDTTVKMLRRFESEITARKPDLIIFYPGLNDIHRVGSSVAPVAVELDEFRENLRKMLIVGRCLSPILFLSAFPVDEKRTKPWAHTQLYYLQEDAQRYTAVGSEICRAEEIPYLPVFETWSQAADASSFSVDGLHGTPQAHERLFLEVQAWLQTFVPPDRKKSK